jgi:hypothetical protein
METIGNHRAAKIPFSGELTDAGNKLRELKSGRKYKVL